MMLGWPANRNGLLLLLSAALVVSSCSKKPTDPTPPPANAFAKGLAAASGRVVNALATDAGIQGSTIDAQGLGQTTSDSRGYFTLESGAQGTYVLRVSSASWVERQTLMKVPGAQASVSLIPGMFDLQFFNEMCRGFGGALLRWAQTPSLVVESAVLEYGAKTATDEIVPEALADQTLAKLRGVLPILTGGRFADFAAIERRKTPPGSRFTIPSGAIALTWQRGLMTGFGHVAYGSRGTLGASDLVTGEVALDADWHIRHLPAGSRTDYDNVVQHELGHTLGYSHTAVSPSFMYEGFLMGISSKDRDAFSVFFQRPSGNRSPDVDPSGTTLNVTAGAAGESWSEPRPIP